MPCKRQLKVIKSDGSCEEYLHTKIIGTINNALAGAGEADIYLAEELADVVTYYLYHKQQRKKVSSSEIFSMIKAVLSETGCQEAAMALNEYHYQRRLTRCRVEVVSVDTFEVRGIEQLSEFEKDSQRQPWDKSRIADDMANQYNFSRQMARMVAGMVEEKVFKMGISLVPAGLVKQLMLGDAAAVLRADKQLQMA